jgi:hypothetical protein
MDFKRKLAAKQEILRLQSAGRIAEFSDEDKLQVRIVGTADDLKTLYSFRDVVRFRQPNKQAYYFLSDELRPGSGVIRNFGGRSEGPGGTMTCLLSSIDGRKNYFVGAGHVLSDFWTRKEEPDENDEVKNAVASIYRYRKGFPATNSTRFLGKIRYLSKKPRPAGASSAGGKGAVEKDIGIVEIQCPEEENDLKQRTTCYGSFGEWRCDPPKAIKMGQRVMKCGAEERHWTYAVVDNPSCSVAVYGPDGRLYELVEQILLSQTAPYKPLYSTDPPANWPEGDRRRFEAPFAVPGDSGTMVVDQESRRPLGMLIAGSILDGRYVMTPIKPLWNFWKRKGLLLLRA